MYVCDRSGSSEQIRYTADLITSYLYSAVPRRLPLPLDVSTSDNEDCKSQLTQTATYKPQYIVHCVDFVTQEPMDIVIDSGLTPSEHTQMLYKKAKKIDRSAVKVKELLLQGQTYYSYLKEIKASLEAINSYKRYDFHLKTH